MTERNIYAIGETVFDIVFRDGQPVSSTAGGAMLNTSISLGRLGLPVYLVSEVGTGRVGNLVMDFLANNRVKTGGIHRFKGETALALAFLDEQDNAHYSFYKNYPEQRQQIEVPNFQPEDIVLFGSFYALSPDVRPGLLRFLSAARNAGALILYDPNFRESHLGELPKLMGYLHENLDFADLVRGSHEDFRFLFDAYGPDDAYRAIDKSSHKVLIYTEGGKMVSFRSKHQAFSVDVPQVNAVSTIGAGDSFNAGLIFGLSKLNVTRDQLPGMKKETWRTVVETAVTFGSIVCETYDNYIPESFARKLHRVK